MKLQFVNVGRQRASFEAEIDVDYREQPEKFEKRLRRELTGRGLVQRKLLDCFPTTNDGAEGIVFAGAKRVGEWRRAAAA